MAAYKKKLTEEEIAKDSETQEKVKKLLSLGVKQRDIAEFLGMAAYVKKLTAEKIAKDNEVRENVKKFLGLGVEQQDIVEFLGIDKRIVEEIAKDIEVRDNVKKLAGLGVKQQDIAEFLGISKRTIARKYQTEFNAGKIKAHTQVKKALFEMAVSKKCVAATLFYLKTQCGFRETDRHDKIPDDEQQTTSAPTISSDPVAATEDYLKYVKGG